MRRPTFLVVGAMKCGTTSLWRYLKGHPQVHMSDHKELDFFSRRWDEGWDWYESQFGSGKPGSPVVAVGEASPSYAELHYYPDVPDRIAAHLPDVRLIYLVRDPIERVRSHYLHNVYRGFESEPLAKVATSSATYTGIGRYATHVDAYLERFAPEQLLVLRSELLRDDRRATLDRVAAFLDIDPVWSEIEEEYQSNGSLADRIREDFRIRGKRRAIRAVPGHVHLAVRARLPTRVRRELADIFRPEVQRLLPHLEPGFDGWGLA